MKKILIIFMSLLFLTGCSTTKEIQKQDFESNDKLSEKISMKSYIVTDDLILFITNNNKETVDLKITVKFFDKSEKVIDTNEDIFSGIKEKKEIAVPFGIYEDYEYYKVFIETTKSNYTNYDDALNITEQKDDKNNQMIFEVKNNGEKDIDYIDLTIIYYNHNQIVGIESELSGKLKKDSKTTFKLGYPVTSKFDILEFDNYKLYINEACTYNNEIIDED